MARDQKHKIPSFEEGMDLIKHVPYVRELVNVHVLDDGSAIRRKGPRLVDSGDYHSLWSILDSNIAYAIKGTELVKIVLDGSNLSITPLANGFTEEVSFCQVNDKIYLTNTNFNSIIEDHTTVKPLGLPTPVINNKTKTYTPLGNYSRNEELVNNILYCYTYIDKTSGEESGTSHITTTPVNIQSISGAIIREYRSTNHGSLFYGPNGELCKVKGLLQLPSGHIIRMFKGSLFVANTNILYWSEPLRYSLYDPASNFIIFDSNITMVEPVSDNVLYVSTEKNTYVLSGETVRGLSISQNISPPAFYKSSTKLSNVNLPSNPNNQPEVAVWLTEYGYMFGLPTGQIINTTYERIRIPRFSRAYTNMHIDSGERRIISTVTSDILYNNNIKTIGDF